MKEEFRYGRLRYISFIVLDLICLCLANYFAVKLYVNFSRLRFYYRDYYDVVVVMLVIDVLVTLIFNTLKCVLCRDIRREIFESLKHILISFFALAVVLFTTKQGAEYSRATVYLVYGFDAVLIVLSRTALKRILKSSGKKESQNIALLITTAGYAMDGLAMMKSSRNLVKGLFITDRTNEGKIEDIPVLVDRSDAIAFLCWKQVDNVYVCGPNDLDVPESLVTACRQMDIPVHIAPANKRIDFEVLKIRTALQKEDQETGLSFFEAEHDVPFSIRRFYTIYESEQESQNGYFDHKQSWHLFFCPFGSIDVFVDTGKERRHITLNHPSVGLILHPGIWREMTWKTPGSVLCVAASGHYDTEKLISNYDSYVNFQREKEWSAVLESAEIMGEVMM